MSNPVNNPPILPRPGHAPEASQLLRFDQELVRTLFGELLNHATRLNLSLQKDGSEDMTGPLVLPSYTVASLPSASTYARGIIYVSNETGGPVIAFSDGTNWRRVTDRNIVS